MLKQIVWIRNIVTYLIIIKYNIIIKYRKEIIGINIEIINNQR